MEKNRVTLHRFFDPSCSLAYQELPILGNDEPSTSLNTGNFMEFPQVLTNHGQRLENHLHLAKVIQFQIQTSTLFCAIGYSKINTIQINCIKY
jgi:hypothetical protein